MRPLSATLLLTLALGLGCGVGYKPGLGAKQLADSPRPHKLIVGYLEQTSADPAVCDLARTDGVALSFADGRVVKALHKGLESDRIAPDRWKRCMLRLWHDPDPLLAVSLGDALLDSIDRFLRSKHFGPSENARGQAFLDVLVQRETLDPLASQRQRPLAERAAALAASLGPGHPSALLIEDLGAVLETEAGIFEGTPLTRARIDRVKDRTRLKQWALRLPDPALRAYAGDRLIDSQIENSPFVWVRENADIAREALRSGPLEIPETAVLTRARWTPSADGTTMLRLLQEPRKSKVRLLPAGRDGTRSADASVDLAGTLWMDVDGFERPLTVCTDTRFDPTPCIPPRALAMTHSVAVLAPTGRIRFPRTLNTREFIELGRDGGNLSAQVVVRGLVAQIDLPIQFDSVPELILESPGRGNGPEVKVQVWELSNDRLLFEVRSNRTLGKKVWRALVESTDSAFSIQSWGSATSVQEGRGGPITVTMHCTHCPQVRKTVSRMVRSTGQAPGKVTIRRARKGAR